MRKNDGGKKNEGKKKAKKADKPGKGEKDEKDEKEKVDKVEKPEKPKDDKPHETKESAPEEQKEQKPDAGKAEKSEKPDKPAKVDKPDKADKKKAKDKRTKGGKEKADKGDDKNDKTKSESRKDPAKADAKKKAKAKKDKSSSSDSSYSSSSSSSDDEDQQQQQQQYLNAMNQWAMMQGMPTAMGTSQMGMVGYGQYAQGQYPGYGAGYGYSDPYGRPYGSSMGEQVPSGCGYMQGAGVSQQFATSAPPPPPPYMPGPMTEEERLADERDKARRRLEDETRLRNEELLRKADAEKAVFAIKNAALALQNGQSDALDNLKKKLQKLVERDLPKCESHAEELKAEVNKAIQEASKRKESLRELKSMIRNGEGHIKATAELIRQNLALEKEKDHEEMSDQLENAGYEAQGMSDRYQSFIEEHSKSLEELQSVTKGPALVDLRLIVAKIKKLGSDLTQTASNAASVVRDCKEKWSRRERAMEQAQRIQDTFALYDADEDGFLSKQEVIQYSQGEFEFTPPETCIDRLWRNLVGPGKEGIAFDNFQQMKMAIGAARVIEKERRKAQSTQEAAATLN